MSAPKQTAMRSAEDSAAKLAVFRRAADDLERIVRECEAQR